MASELGFLTRKFQIPTDYNRISNKLNDSFAPRKAHCPILKMFNENRFVTDFELFKGTLMQI